MKWGSVDSLVQNKCHCACGSFPLHMGLSNYCCPSFAAAGVSGCGGKRFAVTFCILIRSTSLQVCLFFWWQSCRNFFIALVFLHGSFGWAYFLLCTASRSQHPPWHLPDAGVSLIGHLQMQVWWGRNHKQNISVNWTSSGNVVFPLLLYANGISYI